MGQRSFLIVFILMYASAYAQLSNKFKICAKYGTYNDCQQLDRTNEIECKNNFNSIDCLINVNSGITSFGSVTAEEALIANQFLQNVVVLGEFRSEDSIGEDSVYQTVVIVNSSYTAGFSSLRGASYCHPGFKYDEEVTELVLQEFELRLFNATSQNICNVDTPSSTIVERHVRTLADFFGPSCRPGPVTEDNAFNQQLRERYPSLCQLCNSGCSAFTNEVFMSSLVCLTERNGGVAVSSLNSVQKFFSADENVARAQNYRCLCRNGTVTTLDNPCVWTKQPWDLIIANTETGITLLPRIKTWLRTRSTLPEAVPFDDGPNALSSTAEGSLVGVLMSGDRIYRKINFFDAPVNLNTYLSGEFNGLRSVPSAQNAIQCGTTVNWCTVSSAEQEKCRWLSQAGANRGIQPIVNCSQYNDKLACLNEINNGNVDLVDIDTDFGYLARRNGLSALAYAETITRNLTMVLIAVRNDSNITGINTLRGRSGCFPVYAGIEWLAFVNRIRSNYSCELGPIVRDFVGDSCMPGAHTIDRNPGNSGYDSRLCGLCQVNPENSGATATTCNTDSTNLFYGNEGALRCLQNGGDFAVITKNDYSVDQNAFRVLCSNGSLASYTGFNVDQACALTVVINTEVVVKNDSAKYNDLWIAVAEFERWFGQDRRKPFELFNRFNGTWDLLFKDSTPGLDSAASQNEYVLNYRNQISQVCRVSSGSVTLGSLLTIVLLFLSVRLI